MAITKSWLKANNRKICAKAITKTDLDGLVVRITPKGKITYSLRYYLTTTEFGEVAGDVLSHFGDNLEDARKALEENYNGCYTSLADYAEELTTDTSEIPKHLGFYVDYERMGRDMELSGDIFTVETGYQEVHIFWSH